MKYETHFSRTLEVLIYDCISIRFYQFSILLLRITVKPMQVLLNVEKSFFKESLETIGIGNNRTVTEQYMLFLLIRSGLTCQTRSCRYSNIFSSTSVGHMVVEHFSLESLRKLQNASKTERNGQR